MAYFTNPSRGGIANSSGSAATDPSAAWALFKTQFFSEIRTIFQNENVFLNTVRTMFVRGSKAAKFPYLGTSTFAGYHIPGGEIQGRAIPHNEKTINVDNMMYSSAFIPKIDELVSHYDYRRPYAEQLGIKLSRLTDKMLASLIVTAARQSANATVTGSPAGTVVTKANMDTDADVLRSAFFSAAQAFDEKNVPEGGRVCTLRPAQYYMLVQDTDAINQDWGGDGSMAQGRVNRIANIPIRKSNNIPNWDGTSAATIVDDEFSDAVANEVAAPADGIEDIGGYNLDYTKVVGLVHTPDAVAMARLLELEMEDEYTVRSQGTLLVCKQAFGAQWFRPECAVEFRKV